MPVPWSRPRPSLLSFCWRRYRPYTSLSATPGSVLTLRPAAPPAKSIFTRCRGLTTLFYSTIIAAASTLDVRAKSSRREQWDEAITNLESELAVGRREDHGGQAAAAAASAAPRKYNDAERQRAKVLFESRPYSPLVGRIASEALGNILEPEKMDWKFEHASFPPQSIYALENERASSSLNPTTLMRMEYTVAKLAAAMLRQVDQSESAGKPGALSDSITDINKMLHDLSQRAHQDLEGTRRMQTPRYTSIHDGQTTELTRSLSNSLLKLLKKHKQGRASLETTVRKICYNLLISPAPPDQRTLTILIERFVKLQQFGLAQCAADAILDSKIRPDEMTISTLLTYHRHSRDRRGFTVFCRKLNGHLKGLTEENPALSVGGTNARRIRRDEASGKNISKIQYDATIHRNLIATNLSFSRLRSGLDAWRNMRGRGIEPNLDVMKDFMRFFAEVGDWWRGIGTWEQIHRLFIVPNTTVNGGGRVESVKGGDSKNVDPTFHTLATYSYHYILKLCKQNARTSHFTHIYADALARGFSLSSLLLPPNFTEITAPKFEGSRYKELKREVKVLERRAQLHELDFRRWSAHALAGRMVLAGASYAQVEEILRREERVEWYRRKVPVPMPTSVPKRETSRRALSSSSSSSSTDNNATGDRPQRPVPRPQGQEILLGTAARTTRGNVRDDTPPLMDPARSADNPMAVAAVA
ncbi:MAG: hypothetical protein M1831_001504 [Alyxoria varia]|nr:MAG: hypothetical protein M1831_001504 [Alyxoria varia]